MSYRLSIFFPDYGGPSVKANYGEFLYFRKKKENERDDSVKYYAIQEILTFSASFIKITESSDDQNLLEEEKLTLYCKALANSGYHIKWYKISKTSYISRPEKSEGNCFHLF